MPRIVALYKTWRGEEFVEASLASIYDYVDNIIFVNSDISWDGTWGPNTVRPVVERWQEKYDNLKKIIHINVDCNSQAEQYRTGMSYIKTNIKCDFVMLIDTDEVWDEEDLKRAMYHLNDSKNIRFNSFMCLMHTYLKSPFYRVDPPEYCKPKVFVRSSIRQEIGTRGVAVNPSCYMPDVYFHHFTMVRDDESELFHKVQLTHIGDNLQSVQLDIWFREKWDKIGKEDIQDLHYTRRFESSWKRIKKVTIDDLPKALRLSNTPIIKKFQYEDNNVTDEQAGIMLEPVSFIIPTCKEFAGVKVQVDAMINTIKGRGEIITTCSNVSAAINRNMGIKQAKNSLIVMLDDDLTGFYPGWDKDLIAPLISNPNIVMVSARLLKPDGSLAATMGNDYDASKDFSINTNRQLPTACVAFWYTGLYFDENYIGSGFEDTDYCRQLSAKYPNGLFITNNRCRIVHNNEKKNQDANFQKNKDHFDKKWGVKWTD